MTSPAWLPLDYTKAPYPPLTGGSAYRSAEVLRAIVDQFDVEHAERYRRRDVTGDAVPETFCNVFLADVTSALGCAVPRFLANAQIAWLRASTFGHGWRECSRRDASERARMGFPVVVAWANPSGPGHVAIAVPTRFDPDDAERLEVAQAGSTNFARGPLERGFGRRVVEFYTHA